MIDVGYVQFAPTRGDKEGNLARIEALVGDAPPAALLVLPELCLSGYALRDRAQALALSDELTGPSVARLTRLAARRGTTLVVGLAERAGDRVYNSTVVVTQRGPAAAYRKSHLFWNERDLFAPGGTGFHPQPLPGLGLDLGLAVCFDYYFAESFGTLARRGARLVAHPANLVLAHAWKIVPVRCLEQRVFCVTANRYGTESGPHGELVFRGRSFVTDCAGEILVEAPAAADDVQVVALDLDRAADKAVTPRNDLFADRRPELYAN